MKLRDMIDTISPVPTASFSKIEAAVEETFVRKNEMIIKADTVCHDIFFVAEGIVRAFSYADGRDITFWIGAEGSVALSMQGYIHDRPGYENIVTLENCRLYHTTVERLRTLYANDIDIANSGRRFAEKSCSARNRTLFHNCSPRAERDMRHFCVTSLSCYAASRWRILRHILA